MSIEVRQLIVKSNVGAPSGGSGEGCGGASQDVERARGDILEECKELIREHLRVQRER